jgi:hypothetical protein
MVTAREEDVLHSSTVENGQCQMKRGKIHSPQFNCSEQVYKLSSKHEQATMMSSSLDTDEERKDTFTTVQLQ